MVFRCDFRRWWRTWCALALLVGVAGGIVLALVAGARRTETAYARFLRAQRAYDVLYYNDGDAALPVLDSKRVAALPEVAEIGRGAFFYSNIGPGIGSV